jgi:hypothetical protein
MTRRHTRCTTSRSASSRRPPARDLQRRWCSAVSNFGGGSGPSNLTGSVFRNLPGRCGSLGSRQRGVGLFGPGFQALLERSPTRFVALVPDAVRQAHGEFESEHPGYCGAQDTFYVGHLKGVGRICQQTFISLPTSTTARRPSQRPICSMTVCCRSSRSTMSNFCAC